MEHKHHVRPRYLGGPESPVIKLSIEEHAIAHRMLWEEFGNKQDWYAWKGLEGSLSKSEIIKGLISHPGESNPFYGKTHTETTKQKMAKAAKKRGGWHKGLKRSAESIERMRQAQSSSPRVKCNHCGIESNKANITRWHNDNCRSK